MEKQDCMTALTNSSWTAELRHVETRKLLQEWFRISCLKKMDDLKQEAYCKVSPPEHTKLRL